MFLIPVAPWYSWVILSALTPANTGPKECSKSLRRYFPEVSICTGQSGCTAPEGSVGLHYGDRLLSTFPGREICLAGTWEISSFSSPSCWINFLNPIPIVALPNQRSPTISERAFAIFVTLLNYFVLAWIHLLLDVLFQMKMDMKIYSKMYIAHKTFIKYY